MVVKRNRHLNQALQKLLVGRGCGSPNVLQSLMRVEESGPVKQLNSLPTLRAIHASLWHRRKMGLSHVKI